MSYVDLSNRFVSDHFPGAAIAVIGGSTARGTRTATSDIDLLLVGEALFADERSSLAGSYAFDGEIFEVFAYTPEAFDEWNRRDIEQHRPVLLHMLLEGAEVRGGRELAELRAHWRDVLGNGPSASAQELAARRYVITDLLDDLRDASDPLERHAIAFTLFERAAELLLLSNQRWLGTGKYLPRRLREWDAARADALATPLLRGDLAAFADRVDRELHSAGGRVQAGFIR
ncbi:nucleotidyltransferase domain-containing protein [Microterricola pindariensis]|uniref:Polymerase nucleotidyl transferase domain-containing protein n=1 Tax=Microterricola pindariensis TaxID=478010 RepID=A0ABX5AV49_9MICO|nr:nucleotidyltransferase domain-containing protein [Microterricola pindariensis]PPL18140.1 hypothetical protein GY24_10705 [Microterricola pindariensis]